MNTKGIMNFIEQIRLSRKITQEEFLHDIISPRQYQRYRNGISIVPIEVIEAMATKLGVDTRKIISDFEYSKYSEKVLVEEFYNSVVRIKYEKTQRLLKELDNYLFLDDENEKNYRLGCILYKLETKRISKTLFLSKVYEMIDYPKVLDYEVITEIESVALSLIYLKNETERNNIINKFITIFNNTKLILSGQNFFTYIQFLFWISLYMGQMENYNEVIKYCNIAIKYCNERQSVFQLEYFYYYLAIAYHKLSDKKNFESNLYKSILLIKLIDSKEYTVKMYNKFISKFNIDPIEFCSYYDKK